MSKYASKVVAQARAWLGCKESDGTHKQIIDVYNSHKPLARGYAVKYTDAWCATFVSAVAIKLGYTDIMPTECGCGEMLNLYKAMGAWYEDDSRTPNPGDVIFYDWQDSGNGDNKGAPDHVGIVEKVSGGKVTIIEGNYSNSVKRRTLSVNAKYIRGYGAPKFDKEATGEKAEEKVETNTEHTGSKNSGVCKVELPMLQKGYVGASAKALQILLIGNGFSCGDAGTDGHFGGNTDKAVRAYQKARGLVADGIVGNATWSSLLK